LRTRARESEPVDGSRWLTRCGARAGVAGGAALGVPLVAAGRHRTASEATVCQLCSHLEPGIQRPTDRVNERASDLLIRACLLACVVATRRPTSSRTGSCGCVCRWSTRPPIRGSGGTRCVPCANTSRTSTRCCSSRATCRARPTSRAGSPSRSRPSSSRRTSSSPTAPASRPSRAATSSS